MPEGVPPDAGLPTALPLPLPYPVVVRRGALAAVGALVRQHAPAHRVAVIADATVARHHLGTVLSGLPPSGVLPCTVPPGEAFKTRDSWARLTDELVAAGCGRDTTVVALGGGVVGDLAGFVAATFLRGVPVVQVPTTLLAMVDAAVGGKTGVDTPAGKNLVGAFHDPRAVLIDPDVLSTLPAPVLRAGLAEVIKHGVIADVAYFHAVVDALEAIGAQGAAAAALPELIAGSVRIKAEVVAEDAREGGRRQVLNFGHTIAHAIEREVAYELAHGEAVAIGMVIEAQLGERLGVTAPGTAAAVASAVRKAGLPSRLPSYRGLSAAALVAATAGDKKARRGLVRYALPVRLGAMAPGEGSWSVNVPDTLVLEVLSKALFDTSIDETSTE